MPDLILLMPVRVTSAKNIEFALRVVAALKQLKCYPKLVLTGPPDPHDSNSMAYFQSLISLRRKLGVENEMHFVYKSGPQSDKGYIIDQRVVSDLYRVADVMFMPSHREGFGMPVLEAGLVGLPVIATDVPAISEMDFEKAFIFSHDIEPQQLAQQILERMDASPEHHLRVKVRQNFTWKAIFERDILPLLE